MEDTATYQEKNTAVIARCKSGDNGAFREIYELYATAMFNTSMRILNNESEAEDILQDSFLSAFRKIGQFDGRASFGSWLKRIVINKSIDVLRNKRIDFVALSDNDDTVEENTQQPDIDYTVADIQLAVSQLPDGYRTIITLYLFEEYSHKMIAAELNISESTSKSQYFRARKKLASLLMSKKENNV